MRSTRQVKRRLQKCQIAPTDTGQEKGAFFGKPTTLSATKLLWSAHGFSDCIFHNACAVGHGVSLSQRATDHFCASSPDLLCIRLVADER